METVIIILTTIACIAFVCCIKVMYDIIVKFLEIKKEGREYHNLFD